MQTDIETLKQEEKEKLHTDWASVLDLEKEGGSKSAGTEPTPGETNSSQTTDPWTYLLIASLVILGLLILFRTGYGFRSIWAWWWLIFLIKPICGGWGSRRHRRHRC